MLGGVNLPADLEDLRKHTNFGGVYDDGQDMIVRFWNASVPPKMSSSKLCSKGGDSQGY